MSEQIEVRVKSHGMVLHNGQSYWHGETFTMPASLLELNKNSVEVVGTKATPQSQEVKPLDELSVTELKELVKSRGIEVVGTGKNGAVRKEDLIHALS